MRAWERRSGESEKAFAAFQAYLRQKAPRTVLDAFMATYRQPDSKVPANRAAPAYFREWSKKFDWEGRAAAYDGWLMEKRTAAEARAVERSGTDWVEEREELRREELRLGKELIARGMNLLESLVIPEDGFLSGRELSSIATAMKTASELRRAAAEYPVVKEVKVSGDQDNPVVVEHKAGFQPVTLLDVLERTAERLRAQKASAVEPEQEGEHA